MKRRREEWGVEEWALTIGLLIFFPPVGIAALCRQALGLRVWREPHGTRAA